MVGLVYLVLIFPSLSTMFWLPHLKADGRGTGYQRHIRARRTSIYTAMF